jgi:hypothetical protein
MPGQSNSRLVAPGVRARRPRTLIQRAAALPKSPQPYPSSVSLIQRNTTLRRRNAALSKAAQACLKPFRSSRPCRSLVGRRTTLPKTLQAYPPSRNVVAPQARLVLKAWKVAWGFSTWPAGRQTCVVADNLASPSTTVPHAGQPCRAVSEAFRPANRRASRTRSESSPDSQRRSASAKVSRAVPGSPAADWASAR